MKKKGVIILVIIGVIVVALGISIFIVFSMNNKLLKELSALTIENIDINKVKDGNYEGNCKLPFVTAKVLVDVKNGKIVSIDLKQHKHGPDPKYSAEKIIEKIVDKQSLDVDAVTGASASSKVIRKAVEIALKKGIE